MEIDCFAPSLGIAIEAQGEHHYVYNSKYIGREEYLKQCKQDHIKAQVIKAHGIHLLCVPSPDTVEDADLEAYLCVELSRLT